ncbi:MAG TPA: T9SS type A sorting domain-containing protein [Ignavibacteriales bacterium]|nr:T9SS type A sorting domain-containing protein [Ignavibacteriales bacterium]
MYKYIRYFLLLLILSAGLIYGRPHRVGQIPNGTVNGCSNCHMSPSGGDARNAFGQLVEAEFLSEGDVVWGPELAMIDSDGDGVSNGAELQDPYGAWTSGQPDPGTSSSVTLPGVSSSVNYGKVTVNFSSMDPHIGNMLSARAINKRTGKEDARNSTMVNSASFALTLDSLVFSDNYYVDFFADLNNNGKYDAPPVDHAWRISVDAVGENTETAFVHNTFFTDIQWKYLLTINHTDFSPHLNQQYSLRVKESGTNKEVFRAKMESVSQAVFAVEVPVIEEGKEYVIESYADINNNKLYDAPPADHAWAISFMASGKDTSITFQHNTNFTDIGWQYALQVNFINMSPHLGQLFELRVYNSATTEEAGRIRIDSVITPDYYVEIPGIENGQSYNVDFYADHNGSGSYDAPPADHAWRLEQGGQSGDAILNFTHNTTFTDIGWTPIGIEDDGSVPAQYSLSQNFPNPFNPATKIRFMIPRDNFVSVKLYDMLGREVAVLLNREMEAGLQELLFDGASLASGVYIYKINAGSFTEAKKMNLLK